MKYTCENCNDTIVKIIEKLPPTIIEQSQTVWNKWDNNVLTFRSNASFEDFVEVRVNGIKLSSDYYNLKEGSIVVELNPGYLSSLGKGNHKVEIESTSGIVTAEFIIEEDIMKNPWIWAGVIALVAIIVLSFTIWLVFIKKKWIVFQKSPNQ